MKLFVKVVKIVVLVFFIGLATLSILGYMLRQSIIELAVENVSEMVDAPLGMDEVTFSLIDDFPKASVEFRGIWVAAPITDSVASMELDTLLRFEKIHVTVETKPLIDQVFKIRRIDVEDGLVKFKVDSVGKSSFDFLLATDSTSVEEDLDSEPLDLTLDKLVLKNITSIYQDDTMKAALRVYIPEIESSVIMDDNTIKAKSAGSIVLSEMNFDGTNVHRLNRLDIGYDLAYNGDTLQLNKFSFSGGDITAESNGKVALGDDIFLDLTFTSSFSNLANLVKLVPDQMLSEYEIGQIAGTMNVDALVKGILNDSIMPHYSAQVNLSDASIRYQDYPLVYNIGMNVRADNGAKNDNSTSTIALNNFHLDFSGNQIDLSGTFQNLDQLRFNVKSKLELDLDASRSLIPDTLVQNPTGKVTAIIESQGVLPDSIDNAFIEKMIKSTDLSLSFQKVGLNMDETVSFKDLSANMRFHNYEFVLNRFNIYLPENKLRLVDNSLKAKIKGSVFNTKSLSVELPSYNLGIAGNRISGSAWFKNPDNPSFSFNTNVNLDLSKLKRLVSDTLVKNMNGKVAVRLKSKGKIDMERLDQDLEKILFTQSSMDAQFDDMTVELPDEKYRLNNLNGRFIFDKDYVRVSKLGGAFSGLDFRIDTTTVSNLYQTVIQNKKGMLKVNGEYFIGDFDYTWLSALMESEEGESKKTVDASEPTNWNMEVNGKIEVKSVRYDASTAMKGITAQYQLVDTVFEVKGKFAVDEVTYGKAVISDISGLYNAKDSVYVIDKLAYSAFEGSGTTAVKVIMSGEEDMEVQMHNQIDKINIRSMLRDMDNLYQEEITYENMSGVASTDNLYLKMNFIGDSLLFPEMRMSGDITFENGGVYNYPILTDMEAYVAYELDSLMFDTVKSHIFIFKNSINVPQTVMASNAFDIEVIGMQSFGDDYRYHAWFNLLEARKGKKENKSREKGMWVVAYSEGRKAKNGLDKDDDRQRTKNRIRTRENSLKLTFHPDWFNFDTGVD